MVLFQIFCWMLEFYFTAVWIKNYLFLKKKSRSRIVTALMPSLFLPHLRTLAQGKRSENCLRFGTGGPSLCLYPLLSWNILSFPALTMAARAKKKFLAKRFAHAISVHYRDFEHAYVYWIWLRGSASYVIILNWQMEVSLNHDHNEMKSFERIITATIFQLKVSLVRLF